MPAEKTVKTVAFAAIYGKMYFGKGASKTDTNEMTKLILGFLNERVMTHYNEIMHYVSNAASKMTCFEKTAMDDIIFELVLEGVLKIGTVYEYRCSLQEYIIDKEKLQLKIDLIA